MNQWLLALKLLLSGGIEKFLCQRGVTAMAIVEGDRFKDKLTGQSFIVKKIMDSTVILEAEDTPNRFCLSNAIVELLFERTENKKSIN
jgi:hypothetical protein